MSAVFGEILTFGQANDRDIQLKVTGDEFYATYETLDGYTAVSNSDRGFLFIVENRSKLGLDQHLPSSGLRPPVGERRASQQARWQPGQPCGDLRFRRPAFAVELFNWPDECKELGFARRQSGRLGCRDS